MGLAQCNGLVLCLHAPAQPKVTQLHHKLAINGDGTCAGGVRSTHQFQYSRLATCLSISGTGASQERVEDMIQMQSVLNSLPEQTPRDAPSGAVYTMCRLCMCSLDINIITLFQGFHLLLSSTFSHFKSLWMIIGEHLCKYLQAQHQCAACDM